MIKTITRLLFFTLNLFIYGQVWGQTISTQAELDAWVPDGTELTGYVRIQGEDITNIDALSSITSIRGTLTIRNCNALTNVNGLSNVTTIPGSITIQDNNVLEQIDSLINLTTINGNFRLAGNPTLKQIDGLSNLTSIQGSITISGNGSLANVDGLSNLTSVSRNLYISDNFGLTNIDGLSNLTNVEGTLQINRNPSIKNINSLAGITTVNGTLNIQDNEGLENIQGLSNITSVDGRISLERNPLLSDISALSNLSSLNGWLTISSNEKLEHIDGLSNLTTIGGYLYLQNNEALENVDGLINVTSIPGNLSINNSPNLRHIDGLSSLTTISGNFYLQDNELLEHIDGLSNLLSVSGRLSIRNNIAIKNIDGLSQLKIIDGNVNIERLGITNIKSLSNVTSIDGSLNIQQNQSLLNIDALSKVTSLTGTLYINNNDALNNIDGLSALTSIEGNININYNDALTNIKGLGSVLSISGYVTISNNESLENIDGLSKLITLSGNLSIERNNSLGNIDGLLKLTSVVGSLNINYNTGLSHIDGLTNISSVTGRLSINSNSSLTHINALSNLNLIEGYVTVNNNESLINIDGLSNLTNVTGTLNINGNNSLNSLTGLANLSIIAGNVEIRSNRALENLGGLEGLTSITGRLSLRYNQSLANIDALSNITELVGYLNISSNNSLANIDGLSNLTAILGTLDISRNDLLTEIDGLSNLESITGYLTVSYNNALTNLDGLSNLESLDGNLNIGSNRGLTNIEGLSNLVTFNGRISISYNSLLAECCILTPLIESEQHGELSIYSNAEGCQSVDEILNSVCGLSVNYITKPPCQGAKNGSIDLTIGNYESLPIVYTWEEQGSSANGSGDSQEDMFSIDGLGSGIYSVTVTSGIDETILENISLDVSAGSSLDILEVSSQNSTFGQDNGSITIGFSGGEGPYAISLTGPTISDDESLTDLNQTIGNLLPGEYTLFLYDANSQTASVDITIVDESVDADDCAEPMDIIILSLVSSAISAEEYKQSKDYFEDFYQNLKLGDGPDESRVAIAEWSGRNQTEIKIDITGDDFLLSDYHNLERSFTGSTDILSALQFGNSYLEANARQNAQKVIIFTFDGCAAFSAAAYADELKESGIIIADIGIGVVNSSARYRELLMEAATSPDMAYFGNDFLQLDPLELAISLAYSNCSGTTSNVYFNRDGTISIDDYSAPGCPYPNQVEVTFTVSSLEQLSIPTGTPISFYHNDPTNYGSSLISTFVIPCSVPAGESETFSTTIPVETATHLYAVLNDIGDTAPAFNLPVTDIAESRYSNNIDNEKICVSEFATLQALKSSVSLYPICEGIVQYTISVCNISEIDAQGVTIEDLAPADFVLTESSINNNGCSTEHTGNYDIPANCCISLTLSYDVSNAPQGYYGDQGVTLGGPAGQTYIDFDGATTSDEDVSLDGQEECGNPSVSFTKEVDHHTICPDHSMTYIYYIDNKSSTPLYNIQFTDELPLPIEWVYKPYLLEGLSIASSESVSGQLATFTIDQIDAETVASFQIDVYVGHTDDEVIATSKATLQGFPSYINGGLEILESNETTTTVLSEIQIDAIDTLVLKPTEFSVNIEALVPSTSKIEWTTTGDGAFSDPLSDKPIYTLGEADKLDSLIGLFIKVNTYCGETGVSVFIKRECELAMERMRPVDICPEEAHAATLKWAGGTGPYRIEELDIDVDMDTSYELGEVQAGLHTYTVEDGQGCRSQVKLELRDVASVEVEHATNCVSTDLYQVEISGSDITVSTEQANVISEVGPSQYLITNIPVGDTLKLITTDDISGCERELLFVSPACNSCLATAIIEETQILTCEEDAILDATGSSQGEHFSVAWLDESGDTLGNEYIYSADSGGEYKVEIYDSNAGCTAQETFVVIDDRDLPSVEIQSHDALCHEESSGEILLSNLASSTADYEIYLDDALITEEIITDLSVGEYELAIEDAVGCTFDTLITIGSPPPIMLESLQNQMIVNQGSDLLVELTTNLLPENIDSVIWDLPISCDNCMEYLLEDVQENLSFQVKIIDNNGCEGLLDFNLLKEYKLLFYMPNAISLSTNNNNFVVNSSDDEVMIEQMSIYDRWGSQVFLAKNFPVNDPQYGWNGTFKNQDLPVGVYTYIITTIHRDEEVKLAGDITLIR